MIKIKSVAVYCGSSNTCLDIYKKIAVDLGYVIANHNIELVFGGGKQGLMGIVAKSTLDNKGRVYGVIPKFLDKVEHGFKEITELLYVETMHERKAKMFERADAFVILPGGFGTLDEAFEIITWKNVGLHKKLIIFLDIERYWEHLFEQVTHMVSQGFVTQEDNNHFIILQRIEDLDSFLLAGRSDQDNYVKEFA